MPCGTLFLRYTDLLSSQIEQRQRTVYRKAAAFHLPNDPGREVTVHKRLAAASVKQAGTTPGEVEPATPVLRLPDPVR